MKNTTEAHFRQRLIKYAKQHGVTKAAIRYHLSRKTVHKWLKRYDGTLASLEDRSRRPHTSPKAHTEAETAKIIRRLGRHGWRDLIVVYQELVERDGYTRSYGGFKRYVGRLQKHRRRSEKSERASPMRVPSFRDRRCR